MTGAAFTLRSGWPWLLLGIAAFHGVAEELVGRGYAFRRLRDGRSFGAAVLATMPLVAATHIAAIDSFKLVNIPADAQLTFSLTLSVVSLTVPMLACAARTRIRQSTSIKEEPCHL